MVKISVIIPVYNVENYLEESLDSIINQTFADLEIICVNDGSTDNSSIILNKYANKDSRIKIIDQKNKGAGAARNSGLDVATGDYIYFFDSDDILELTALEELYKIAYENSLDLIIFKLINFIDETGEEFKVPYHEMSQIMDKLGNTIFSYEEIVEFLDDFDVTPHTKFFKKDLISEIRFDENVIFEDNLFTVDYIFNAKKIYLYNKYLYHRRVRQNSIMTTTSKNHIDTIEVANKFIDKVKKEGYYNLLIDKLFTKKVDVMHFRINSIDNQYKEYFFEKVKLDFQQKNEEYQKSVNFNQINKKIKSIYNNVLQSNNYIEFDLKNRFFDIVDNNSFDMDLNLEEQILNSISQIKYFGKDDLKQKLTYYISQYKKMYYFLINTPFLNDILLDFIELIKKFLNLNLSIQDKIDLLKYAKPLFIACENNKINIDKKIENFILLINNNECIKANNLILNKNSIWNNDNKNTKSVYNKDIIMLFWGLDLETHGLLKAVFDKANLFKNNGFNVTILNDDSLRNYNFIVDNHYKLNNLNSSIKVINIYDYYSHKNTFNFDVKWNTIDKIDIISDNIEKIVNNDNSISLKYFNENNVVKEELYIDDYLALKKVFENDNLRYEYYYTYDGFNYFYIDYLNNDFILFDRKYNSYISFKDIQEFEDYFVTEICVNSDEKPFLINDCSSIKPNIKDIDFDVAYKIGVVHNNPYFEPFCPGSGHWYLASLDEFMNEDAVVVLTESSKKDFVNEFKGNNFHVIPNFVKNEDVKKAEVLYEKEDNIISIFARISRNKNISDLINAFVDVLKVHDDAILRIYGRAILPEEIEEKKKLTALIDKLDLNDSVKLMGPTNNVFEEMSKSLATVLCSNIEGLPLVILESMINCTPVISYDTNYGPRDVIVNGDNGFIIDRYDIKSLSKYIIKLMDNPKLAHEMGNRAKQHILDNFSEDIVFEKWKSLFKELCTKDIQKE